jgi:Holliday junction resolvasome RuvABC endonuclease subunit
MRPTLALDLGTTTGWAVWFADGVVTSGAWLLATPKELRQQRKYGGERRGDLRFHRLRQRIADTIAAYQIEQVVFEDVLFLSSQAQSQLWASLRAAIWCYSHQIRVDCVHTGTLKKFATGSGNADKAAMAAALAALPPPWSRQVRDDNEADALWILRWKYCVAGMETARAALMPDAS